MGAGRPKKYPEGCKEYWRKKKEAAAIKKYGVRADGKPKHFRVRRTNKEIKRNKANKKSFGNNYQVDSPEFKKLLANTVVRNNKIHLFRMSQYISIARIETAIKAVQESPEGLVLHEFFIKAFGGIDVTVVFSFLLYMEHQLGVGEYPDSYFCSIYRHMVRYCGISQDRVARAIKQMEAAGLIDRKRVGVPAKVHYRIDKIVMMELLYEANQPGDYKGQDVLVKT